MEAIAIELAPGPTEDVRVLVGELEGVLSAEYAAEQRQKKVFSSGQAKEKTNDQKDNSRD